MKEGWQVKKLGDVCEFLNRGLSPKYLEEGGIRVLNQKCVRDHLINYEPARRHDSTAKKMNPERFVRLGDVLVNSTGTGTLGRVAQIREEISEPTTVDSHMTIVRPISGKFFPVFFGYMMITIEEEIQNAGEGCGGQTELARSVLSEKFTLRFPDSISEQQRIVALLDEAFEAIATAKAHAEQNLKNARALFESQLDAVFRQRGEGWVENGKPLSDMCALIIDCEHKTAPTQKNGGGYPSIRTTNIGKGKFLLEGVNRVSEDTYREWTRRAVPQAGDLIFAREAPAGNVAVVTDGINPCLGQRTVLIRPNAKYLDPNFLALLLLSPEMQEYLLSHSRGATVQHINMKDIRALKLGAIPNVTEQKDVVGRFNDFSNESDRLEALYRRKIAALDELKASLLHKAFAGEL